MTEEETREWQRKNPKPLTSSKKKWNFMQKYYHKGAFFQSESNDRDAAGGDAIQRRDFSAPTGEDKMDKTILPKVMQVKHFGHSGRTKWTHLVAEDTTKWDNPYMFFLLFFFFLSIEHPDKSRYCSAFNWPIEEGNFFKLEHPDKSSS
jgi:microfibrillar-associated protein 1